MESGRAPSGCWTGAEEGALEDEGVDAELEVGAVGVKDGLVEDGLADSEVPLDGCTTVEVSVVVIEPDVDATVVVITGSGAPEKRVKEGRSGFREPVLLATARRQPSSPDVWERSVSMW